MSFSQTTTNFGFRLIDYATDPYINDEWFNWQLLDGVVASALTTINFAKATGTGAAYVLSYTPANTSLAVGQRFDLVVNVANTGACTLNVDNLGAHSIKVNGQDPAANTFPAGMFIRVLWDGTNFNVIYPSVAVSQGAKVVTASSGATPVAGATDFTIESNTNVGWSVLTSLGSGIGKGYFGTVSKPDAGGLYYDFSVDRLYFRAGQTNGPYLDSHQVIRQPQLPVFYAYTDQISAVTFQAANTTFIASTALINQDTAYNTTTGVFTAPIAGLYEFAFEFTSTVAENLSYNWQIGFMVNGTQQGPTFRFVGNGYNSLNGLSGSIILNLSANDAVKVNLLSGSTGLVGAASKTWQWFFSGYMLP